MISFNPYYNNGIFGTRYGCTDSNGNLWTTDGSTQIYVTSPAGVLLRTITTSQYLQTPQLAADKNGHVYAVLMYLFSGTQWAMYDVTGTETLILQTAPNYNNGRVNGWGTDGSNIYFLASNLYAFNFTTQITTRLNSGNFGSGKAFAVVWHSPTNTIWMHDVEGGFVYVFSITGTLLQTITVQGAVRFSSRKIMIASDATNNLIWIIWDTFGGGSMRLASINPATYTITDKTSLITGYNPACINSFPPVADGSHTYDPGVWITTYNIAPNNSKYILSIFNGIVNPYIPVYESHLESVDSGIVLLTFLPFSYDDHHRLKSTLYIPSGSGCYIASGVIELTPVTVLADISSVSATEVTVTCNIPDQGGALVTECGVCYGTSVDPDISGTHVIGTFGSGLFSVNLTDLLPSIDYYIRAYAINAYGVSYSLYFLNPADPNLICSMNVPWAGNGYPSIVLGSYYTGKGSNLGGFNTVYKYSLDGDPSSYTIEQGEHDTNIGNYTGGQDGEIASYDNTLLRYKTSILPGYSPGDLSGEGNPTSGPGSYVKAVEPFFSLSGGSGTADFIIPDGTSFSAIDGLCTCSDTLGLSSFTFPYGEAEWTNFKYPPIVGYNYGSKILAVISPGGWGMGQGDLYYYWRDPIITRVQLTTTVVVPKMGSQPITVTPGDGGEGGGGGSGGDGGTIYLVVTTAVNNILGTQARGDGNVNLNVSVNGNIDNAGLGTISERGVCYSSVNAYPTLSDSYDICPTVGTGNYSTVLSSLVPGSTVHIRTYAKNEYGIVYSDPITMTVAPVINDKGICWNTTGMPTTSDHVLDGGSVLGSFSEQITRLTPGQTYYARTFAIITTTTFYGNEVAFTTKQVVYNNYTVIASNPMGSVTTTISIGVQPVPF